MANPVEFVGKYWKPIVIGVAGVTVAGRGVVAYLESQQSEQPGLRPNAPVIESNGIDVGEGQEGVESTATPEATETAVPTPLPDCEDVNHTMRVGPETPFPHSGLTCVMGDGQGGSWLFGDIGESVDGTPVLSLVHIDP